MKTLAFFFGLLLCSFYQCQAQGLIRIGGGGGGSGIPTVRHPMNGISPDSARFTAIFADVSTIAAKRRGLKSVVKIVQTLSPGLFLAQINASKTVAFEYPGREFADDTELTISVENTGRLHSYITTLGSNATVAVYKLTNPQEKFTRERFIASLKAGETYTVRRVSGSEKKDLLIVWE